MTTQYLEEKRRYNNNLLNVISLIRYDNYKIELLGSASLQSQKYYSDYDLFSVIKKDDTETAFNKFNKILENIKENPYLYFIELKIQTKNNEKYKINPKQKLTYNNFEKYFKDVDFVKIDLVNYDENTFMEVSIIYKIDDKEIEEQEYKKSLTDDIKDLITEKKYYKALKRFLNIFRLENKTKKVVELTNFFNSNVGLLYRIKSNLEAIDLVKEYYKDKTTKKRIELNLKHIKPFTFEYNNITYDVLTNFDKLNEYINNRGLEQMKKMKLI